MTDAQNDTPAASAGETTGVDTSNGASDFVELVNETSNDTPSVGDDGIVDWDAVPPKEEGKGDVADGDKKPAADEAKSDDDKAKEAEEEKKRLSGAQRAKLQRQSLLDQIAERDRQIEELSKAGKAAQADDASAPKPPKEEDFNGDWFAYQRALAAHDASEAARKATQDVLRANEDAGRNRRAAVQAAEREEAHLARVEKAREIITDFDTTMEGMKGINVRTGVIDEIKSADNSALIAYHFAQNPGELSALNEMTPRDVTRTIAKLDATLKLPEPKKQTTAPAPLSQRKGGASPALSQEARLNSYLERTYGKNRK